MPLDPAFRLNVRAHLREEKNNAGIRPPRPAKINPCNFLPCGEPAVRENEAGCAGRRDPTLRRDVSGSDAADFASLENSARIAEDEVHRAFDISVFVQLPSRSGVKRVLPSE